LLDPTATRLAVDDAKALRVLEYLRRLGDDGLLVRRADYQGSVGIFNAGDTGFYLNGEWEVSTFQNNKLPFSMTRVPALFGSRAAQADSHTFVLPHQDGRGGAGNRAAHQFVAWMLRHSVEWAKGGHVPAYLPTLDRPAYRRLEPQSAYRDVIDDVALDPPAWFAGSASRMWIELGSVFSGVLTGSRSPRGALEEAKSRLRDLLDTPSPLGEPEPPGRSGA
ncbi:extracellular solute-binding protein, partial [Streptomyces boncukensis]|nr:ABC transporter substrate-binding protein [Streptomyces boncukensis]